MKSEKVAAAEITIDQCKESLVEVNAKRNEYVAFSANTESRLKELRDKLPDLVCSAFIGETSEDQVQVMKSAIKDLEFTIAVSPGVLHSFDRRQKRLFAEQRQASRIIDKFVRYQELKTEYGENPNIKLESDLMGLAKHLDLVDDFVRFVALQRDDAA